MKDIIYRHKSGEHIGICSVCSAHPLVIEAALRFDLSTNNKVLIEATSNQVNQFGGYTGMQPVSRLNVLFLAAIIWARTVGKTNRPPWRWKNLSTSSRPTSRPALAKSISMRQCPVLTIRCLWILVWLLSAPLACVRLPKRPPALSKSAT